MTNPFHSHFTTLEAIAGSIVTDAKVYHWFKKLVLLPAKVNHFKTSDLMQERLQKLKFWQGWSKLWMLGLLIFLGALLLMSKPALLWTSGLFVLPLFCSRHIQQKLVAQLGADLLQYDYKQEILKKKTLYQIGEDYAKKHQIPSLVDTIDHSERVARALITAAAMLTFLTLPYLIARHPELIGPFLIGECIIGTESYAVITALFVYQFKHPAEKMQKK